MSKHEIYNKFLVVRHRVNNGLSRRKMIYIVMRIARQRTMEMIRLRIPQVTDPSVSDASGSFLFYVQRPRGVLYCDVQFPIPVKRKICNVIFPIRKKSI